MTTRARAAKLPIPRESEVMRAVADVLRWYNVTFWRNNTGALINAKGRPIRFGVPGSADYMMILPGGRFGAIEVKRPGKRPTAKQLAWLRAINAEGGCAIWTDDAAQLAKVMPHLIEGWGVCVTDNGGLIYSPPKDQHDV